MGKGGLSHKENRGCRPVDWGVALQYKCIMNRQQREVVSESPFELEQVH